MNARMENSFSRFIAITFTSQEGDAIFLTFKVTWFLVISEHTLLCIVSWNVAKYIAYLSAVRHRRVIEETVHDE